MKNTLFPNPSLKTALILVLATTSFQACSTAKVRILPGEDGINRVVSKDIEKENAEEAALKKANDFCEDQNKKMYVVKEDKTAYQGSMNENTRKAVRNGSKAAMILGGPAGVLSRSVGVGGAVSGAGMAGYSMTSDRDYEAQFTFRCR
jgi:hypothetical protein